MVKLTISDFESKSNSANVVGLSSIDGCDANALRIVLKPDVALVSTVSIPQPICSIELYPIYGLALATGKLAHIAALSLFPIASVTCHFRYFLPAIRDISSVCSFLLLGIENALISRRAEVKLVDCPTQQAITPFSSAISREIIKSNDILSDLAGEFAFKDSPFAITALASAVVAPESDQSSRLCRVLSACYYDDNERVEHLNEHDATAERGHYIQEVSDWLMRFRRRWN